MVLGLLWAVLSASALYAVSAQDDPKNTIFQIGKFDRSSAEFASGNPVRNVDFIVSQSDPAKDWFAAQPAVLIAAHHSGEAAIASAPRAITFSLEGPPADNYRLHIALLVETPSLPALKVDINGKVGIFYLHPKLDYSNGDPGSSSFNPVYSAADVEFTFPGSYLRKGPSKIAFQVIAVQNSLIALTA
jgi:hypothetical protein